MEERQEVFEITEESLQKKIYYVRGQRVMLDFELAEIYGYETKNFNRQVKNNIEKFEGDFMFQLTEDEYQDLRCKNFTANFKSKNRTLPHAFTEQGIYMLMTVLRGDLAVKQSKALIRTFKRMKDYILNNRDLIGQREYIQLSMQTAENIKEISKLKIDMSSVEKQMSDVMDQLGDVVTKSDLAEMMNSFVDNEDNGWLMYNTKYCAADLAYSEIYKQANNTIYVVDNYIGLRTLVMLKNASPNVEITMFSDNVGNKKLHNVEYEDFRKEYPHINISMKTTKGIFHDRFIVLDYGVKKYKSLIEMLLKNPNLILT